MAKVVTLNPINPITFEYQDYSNQDSSLIVNFQVEPTFNPLQNYVAYFIYDLNDSIIFSNEIDFKGYSFLDGQVFLDPENDVENAGYEEGEYNVVYNFLNNELSSSFSQRLYIDQISPDRTEIRLNTTQIPNQDLISGATSLINQIQSNPGVYFDFFVDFGGNQLVIANNMLLDTSNLEDPTVLIKLYEPLPPQFDIKSECWVVTQVADSVAYNINITQNFETLDESLYLKGPNLNLNVKDQINNSTAYVDYSTLTTSSYATGSNNLQYQINSILAERGIEINVDYSNYSNFIYFSSALTRLENFYYKLQLIEEYQYSSSLSNLTGPSAYVVSSKNIWEEKINEIITTFDGYDYYLYYTSGSTSWPKTNSIYPYINATTTSPEGIAFITTQSISASSYDENNNNVLINSIPEFLRNDPANAEYELFIEMLGEMFDNIWIYYQDVTNKWDADNRLQYGVSKDLVADILRDLGLKIYQSSFGSADLYTALLGITPSGSLFPFPYMTGSLPSPTGYEYINSSISASDAVVPLEDIEKGTYKRLYHNLPMLLKKKGTTVGIQDLVTAYGIPSTILRVAEFGGKDKDETNDWDYYKQRYNNAYNFSQDPDWVGSEFQLNPTWTTTYTANRPETVLFRFKTTGIDSAGTYPSQSLFVTDQGSLLALQYSGSINTSGSWSGSAINPYNEYANLVFYPDSSDLATSASVYLPFFDGGWWTTAITIDGASNFTLYAANNIYNGDDGSQIGFIASASVSDSLTPWDTSTSASLGSNLGTPVSGFDIFSGSFQELRYYTTAISDNSFRDTTMNPDSIEVTTLNSSPNQLAFRAPLGGELYTGSVSIHPKVTGSWEATSSFTSDSNFYIGSPSNFVPNVKTVYLDQPIAGIKNIVSNKIQIVDMNLPSGSTLSQYRSVQQQPAGGSTYTENLAYTEVAFSPQNEINDDIMDQLGFFNVGEFIGDPRQRFTQAESYPDLDALRNAYFEKYVSNYDLNDYIRLIKFFDNSLFKMIKDFTPARASLASGVVVKQTLLERNKYPQPEVEWARYDYSGSIDTAFITGSPGGTFNQYNGLTNVWGVTQSWSESIITPYGLDVVVHSSQDEFYNGELSGSEFVVENGELNSANPFKQVPTTPTNYTLDLWGSEFGTSENTFLGTITPTAGTASFWSQNANSLPLPGNPDPYIKWVKIHRTDIQGNDNSLSLQYLENLVTNYSKTRGPFIIISISPRDSGDYYLYEFAPGNAAYSFPGPPVGNVTIANQQIVLSPYLTSENGPFQNSDYNPLINNAEFNRLSNWVKAIDYATNQLTPVNFATIISGTAYPAEVQDSNYTSYQYSGIRYWGSKNTTDDFNTASISESIYTQNYQNDNIGATTLGYASVDKYDTGIYEFAWGGGTYPEIAGGGAIKLSQILNVDTTSSVGIISPLSNYFGDIVQSNLTPNSQPQFTQYVTTANIPNTARVMTAEFGVPTISNYMIAVGSDFEAIVTANLATVTFSNSASLVTTNSSGYYISGSSISGSDMIATISSSLSQGDRWFMSYYYNMTSPVDDTLLPINVGYSSSLSDGSYTHPVARNGVYEITSAGVGSANSFTINPLPRQGKTVGNDAGILIWKAITDNTFVMFNGSTLSGVGKGNIIAPNASPTVKNNLTYITQTYGTNPKNQ